MKQQIKAVIIDDEEALQTSLIDLINMVCKDVTVIGIASNVTRGAEIVNALHPDVVFLDINLPDGNGFNLLEQLGDFQPYIIFTTAYSEFAIRAFKVKAIDYLLKPIDPDDLTRAINRTRDELVKETSRSGENPLESGQHKIALATSKEIYIVDIKDIVHCVAQDNYTQFHFVDRKPLLVSKTLKQFADILEPLQFERIHKSHLINLKHLHSFSRLEGGFVKMNNGTKLPVSVRKREHLLKVLKSFPS